MRAVICTAYGPPEVLQLREVAKPAPQDNQILIKIAVTTVTAGDTRIRAFRVPPTFWLPARLALGMTKPRNDILGMELAGEVEVVGKAVTKFKPGDAVFAALSKHGFGGYAEYKCLPEDGLLALRSDKITAEEAVTIPVGGRTALYFLRTANIQSGQTALIYGASGSVGAFAVQLAKYFGAHVTGVCSTANLDLVQSLGADRVIDYTQEHFAQNGQTYDVIFDTVGKASYSECINALNKNGAYLQAVAAPGMSLQMQWTARTTGKKTVGGGPPFKTEDMVYLQTLMEAGHIKPIIDRRYPLEQIVEAHRYVDTGRKKGNVIITIKQLR